MSTHKKYCEKMDYRQRMIYNLIDHVRSNRAKVRDPCLEQKLQAHISQYIAITQGLDTSIIQLITMDYNGGSFDTTANDAIDRHNMPEGRQQPPGDEEEESRWIRLEVTCREKDEQVSTYVKLGNHDDSGSEGVPQDESGSEGDKGENEERAGEKREEEGSEEHDSESEDDDSESEDSGESDSGSESEYNYEL